MFQRIIALYLLLWWVLPLQAGGLMVVAPEGTDLLRPIVGTPRRPLPPMPPSPFQMTVKSEKVKVDIVQQTAQTHIEQVFYNPSGNRLEGYFLFPAPAGAVITNFTMWVNGKELTAELLDAAKARGIYENIVRQFRDPTLLEYIDRDLFKVRIFPIMPQSDTRISLSYSQVLTQDDGTVEYIYPLATQQHAPQPTADCSIAVSMKHDVPFKNIYCPTHPAEVLRRTDRTADVVYEARALQSDADFKLYYTTDATAVGASVLAYKRTNEDGFFMLTLSPGMVLPQGVQPVKDIVFVLDVSGSMAGDKMNKAKAALQFCVANLNAGDRFDVVRFSTEARALYEQLQPADAAHLAEAQQFVENLKPIGGTNIGEALQMALRRKTSSNRPFMVAFITDGKPTIGTTDEETLVELVKKDNTHNTRIFTVGIGDDLNAHLLDRITELTRSYRTYIGNNEDIELKLSSFYTKISSPIMSNISIKYSNNVDVYDTQPHDLPDLFRGSAVTVLGRYRHGGNLNIQLSGTIDGKTEQMNYPINLPQQALPHDFVPTLWASRQVGYLLDQIRLHGNDAELTDEVVRLAKLYGIVTPFTSYLIVEDDVAQLPPTNNSVPHPMPSPPKPPPHIMHRNAAEYNDLKKRDASNNTRASSEIQTLNQADNIAATKAGQNRLDYTDDEGKQHNTAAQYRNVQGRALYRNEQQVWVDSELNNANQKLRRERVQFGSDAYFTLLKNKPNAAPFLALGNQVQFVLEGVLYDVYD